MLHNLLAEMARREITTEKLAQVAGINERTAYNKIREISKFTIKQSIAIQEQLFPECELKYLFASTK